MRIRMRYQISGTRNGKDWPAPGGEMDLPTDEAVSLIGTGMAEAVAVYAEIETADAKSVVETRQEAPKAPVKRPPGRPRKTTNPAKPK